MSFHQKPDNKSYCSRRKILETPVFLELFSGRRFHLILGFLYFVDNEGDGEATCGPERFYKLKQYQKLKKTIRQIRKDYPPTRMNAPHYMSCIIHTAPKQKPC
jgi:hypothetical protein